MSVLPASLLATLFTRAVPWATALREEDVASLEARLSALPVDVQQSVLAALADPDRAAWGRGVLDASLLAVASGAKVVGLMGDDVVELTDRSGSRFGLALLPFEHPVDRWGSRPDLDRLLTRLDAAFSERPFVIYLRRPLPKDIDHDGIVRAVNLWLAAVERGERNERHAVYEDGDIAFELTLVDATSLGPRVLTVGPVTALERLAQVDSEVVEHAVRLEESLGEVPIAVGLISNAPWALPRGYVEQLLFGTADAVQTTHGPGGSSYQAQFRPNGRSLFSDPVCRNLVGLWFIEPMAGEDPLAAAFRAFENPWARAELDLALACSRFARTEPIGPTGSASLQWLGPEGEFA